MATLPGCNTFNNIIYKTKSTTKTVAEKITKSSPSKEKEEQTVAQPKKSEAPKKKGNDKTNEKDVTQDVVLPRDREKISQNKETPTYTSSELAKGVLKSDWAIETVNGKPAVGEKAPFIRFSPSDKMIYGNNGCNVINASYKYNPADSTLSFSHIASTMMLCNMEGLTDYEISAALELTKFYTWKIKDNDFHLYFLNEARQPVMSLMHQNFDFLNGSWHVAEINGNKVNSQDMNLVIDVDEGKIHGNTGCNILNGIMEIDMEQANSISFSRIATTRKACPTGNQETELLVALEDTSTAKPTSKTTVLLLDSQGKEVLRLIRK